MHRHTLALLSLALAACADPSAPHSQALNTPSGQIASQTRIESDQATGAIRFLVDGKEQALIDADGLHVRQNVEAGTLSLTGTTDDTSKP